MEGSLGNDLPTDFQGFSTTFSSRESVLLAGSWVVSHLMAPQKLL